MKLKDVKVSKQYREVDSFFDYGKRNYRRVAAPRALSSADTVDVSGKWKMWKDYCTTLLREDKFDELERIMSKVRPMWHSRVSYEVNDAVWFVINEQYLPG